MQDPIGQEEQAVTAAGAAEALPVGFVPTPTREYNSASARDHAQRQSIRPALKLVRSADAELGDLEAEGAEAAPAAAVPVLFGSRALIYKQDPSVVEIGVRKVLLRGLLASGPRSARIQLQGVASVAPNMMNDFIQTPGSEAFDAVHCFAVVHQALTMCQRAMRRTIRWQWNSATNIDPILVSPRAGETMNAFYSRTQKALKFFFFRKPGTPVTSPRFFTCRSFDIVAHETAHAVLDSLKPDWIGASANPQTGALHESFGDILAIFLALSQLDQVEALVVQTKGDLHNKTFLSDVAEEFGLALGRDNGLRNADNDKRMSDVTEEVHDLSQVFTGGIYDVLADMFAFERKVDFEDEAATLFRVGQYLFSLVLRAIMAAPAVNATFASVVNKMLVIAAGDGMPVEYRNFIRNRFALREVVAATSLDKDMDDEAELEAVEHPHLSVQANGLQNRSACCGTLRRREYSEPERELEDELERLREGIGGCKDEDAIAAE